MAHDIILSVTERAKRDGIFDCCLGERYLCSSPAPFIDGCRALLAQGYDPTASVVMRHSGSSDDAALSGVLAQVANVQIGGDGVGFRPRPEPATAPPVRFSELAAVTLATSHLSSSAAG
jgi:hypothetical protein